MLIYVLRYQNQPVVFFNVLHLKEYNLVPDWATVTKNNIKNNNS